MKWLFVQSRSFHCWEALGIGYLISTLRRAGERDIEFKSGFFDHDQDILRAANEADIVGFGCTSPQMSHATSLAKRITTHKILGGVHPSAMGVAAFGEFDQIVKGEGEKGILSILNGNRAPIVDEGFIKDIDSIPFPDRKAIKQWRNVAQAKRETGERIGALFSSRGCFFNCTFCASKALWGRKVRFRSASSIYQEFKRITRELRLDFVKFSDDAFGLKRDIAVEFCDLKLRASDDTPWGANVRASSLDKSLVRFMHLSKCRELWIGVESGSPAILKNVKKNITLKKIKQAFAICRQVGIKTRAYVILGTPLETYKTIKQTEKLIDEIKPDTVGFSILAPYPGTAYYDFHKHKDVDFSKVDEYDNDTTETKGLSNADIRSEQTRLVNKYSSQTIFRQKDKVSGNGSCR